MPKNSGTIGVFDSGLGGLTVVRALRRELPKESITYVGDTARVPYGNKSATLVTEYSMEIAEFLVKQDAKLIVVACNTASAVALEPLQKFLNVPVIGVIEPGAEAASRTTISGKVGVLGTLATVGSKAYDKALEVKGGVKKVTSQACPLLVPLAEEGWLDGNIAEEIISIYLEPVLKANVDTIILGCTHYPILKHTIMKVAPGVSLVDSADTVATAVKDILQAKGTGSVKTEKGILNIYVTDLPARFEAVARRFLGEAVPEVKTIHLPVESQDA